MGVKLFQSELGDILNDLERLFVKRGKKMVEVQLGRKMVNDTDDLSIVTYHAYYGLVDVQLVDGSGVNVILEDA